MRPIAGRRNALSPYGITFLRDVVRAKGENPVWYYGIGSPLEASLQSLFNQAFSSGAGAGAASHPTLALFPYFEGVGQLPNGRTKEFSWEREWRHVGDFEFDVNDVAAMSTLEASHRVLSGTFGLACVNAQLGSGSEYRPPSSGARLCRQLLANDSARTSLDVARSAGAKCLIVSHVTHRARLGIR